MEKLTSFSAAMLMAILMSGPAWAFGGDDSSTDASAAGALVKQARELIDNKTYKQAIGVLEKAITASDKNADAYNLLGYSQRKLKKFAAAEASYGQALTIDPSHKGALEYLGELYLETNRRNKAQEMLSRLEDVCSLGC